MAAKTFTEFKNAFRFEYGRLPTLGETWKAAKREESRKTVRAKRPVQQAKYAIKEPCAQCDIGLIKGDRFCSRCGRAL
jgi:hypothetical protein